jgi:hypothetical protein
LQFATIRLHVQDVIGLSSGTVRKIPLNEEK